MATITNQNILQINLDNPDAWVTQVFANGEELFPNAEGQYILADGTYDIGSIVVHTNNIAGATSIISNKEVITIDTVAPEKSTLALDNDTGSSNIDGISADGTLKITTPDDGRITYVIANGTILEPNANGEYVLPEGSYAKSTIFVVTTDEAGNQTVSRNASTIVIDQTAADVPVISFPEDANANGILNVVEVGADNSTPVRISLPTGTELGDSVEITINGAAQTVVVDSAALANGYVDVAVATDNIKAIDATAYVIDAAGNQSPTATNSVTVDTTGPGGTDTDNDGKGDEAPVITFPEDTDVNGTLNAAEVGTDNSTPVRISLPTGTELGDSVEITINGVVQSVTVDSAALANNYVEVEVATDGITAIDASAYVKDEAGNESATAINSVAIDLIAPAVTFTDLVTVDSTPELTGTVDDPTATVIVTINGIDYQATNNGDGTWTLADNVVATLTDATTQVSVTATDPAGNVGQANGTVSIIPQITSLSLIDNDWAEVKEMVDGLNNSRVINYSTKDNYTGEISADQTDTSATLSNLTNDVTPEVRIALSSEVPSGYALELYSTDGTLIASSANNDFTLTTTSSGVVYSFTDSVTENTSYTYTAKLVVSATGDVSDTTNAIASAEMTLDTVNYIVPSTAKYSGGTLTLTLSGENEGSVYMQYVNKQGKTVIVSAQADDDGVYTLALTNWAQKSSSAGNTLYVVDAAGNVKSFGVVSLQDIYASTMSSTKTVTYASYEGYWGANPTTTNGSLGYQTGDKNDWIFVREYISNKSSVFTYGGDDVVTVGTNIDNSTVDLGSGDNVLTVGNIGDRGRAYVNNGSVITAGDGNDSVTIGTNVDYSTINLGNGDNNLTIGNYVNNRSSIVVGDGNDNVSIGTNMDYATLALGDGNNNLTIGNYVTNRSAISAGNGDDNVSIGTNVDYSNINLGNGDNNLTIGNYVNNRSSIVVGSGNDNVSIGTNMDYASVSLGDGDNNLTIGNYVTNKSTISAGSGNDVITVGTNIHGSQVHLGSGDNILTVGKIGDLGRAYVTGGSVISAGDGNDTLLIGTNLDGSTVNLGNGDNSLTIGNYVTGSSAVTLGSGNDNVEIGYVIGGYRDTINLGGGDDIFHTNQFANGTLVGGDGNDQISITTTEQRIGATGGTIYGGNGQDTITIDWLGGARVVTSDDTEQDIISVKSMTSGTISLGAGDELSMSNYMSGGSIVDATGGSQTISLNKMQGGSINLGGGDDTISIETYTGGTINGGSGNDTLSVTGSGSTLSIKNILNFETIDLTGTGSNTLKMEWTGNMTSSGYGLNGNTVYVKGDQNDTVDLGNNGSSLRQSGGSTWSNTGDQVTDQDGNTYNVWQYGSDSNYQVYIQESITNVI